MKYFTLKSTITGLMTICLPMSVIASQSLPVKEQPSLDRSIQSYQTPAVKKRNAPLGMDCRISIGALNVEAKEYVYFAGEKISQLDWESDTVAMLGAGISITPLNWLKLNLDGQFAISDGNGELTDTDWAIPDYDWTHKSEHGDVTIDGLSMIDLNVEFTFLSGQDSGADNRLFAIAGYKWDNFEWSVRGGEYIYSTGGFRDDFGYFPSGVTIGSYEQTYSVPYIGIGFNTEFEKITLSGRLTYSPIADMSATDNHYLRELRYSDDIDGITYVGLNLGVGYKFNDQMSVQGNFMYQRYEEESGSGSAINTSTGAEEFNLSDVSGAENTAAMISVAFVYKF